MGLHEKIAEVVIRELGIEQMNKDLTILLIAILSELRMQRGEPELYTVEEVRNEYARK